MKAEVVLDLQFGSTGKGLVCGMLAQTGRFDAAVCAWGPNSGHTAYIEGDPEFQVVHTMVPISLAVPGGPVRGFIAPGAVLDVEAFRKDIESVALLRDEPIHVYVHECAAVVCAEDRAGEESYAYKIGSTQKGTGEALIRKLRRSDERGIARGRSAELRFVIDNVIVHVLDSMEWEYCLNKCDSVLVEGSQGFSLGLNSGFWPYCTSRECSLAQILSDCLIAPSRVVRVHGVARTFPIRVANRHRDGEMVGFSGPGYDDQEEIDWSDVGVPAEITTVTKLPRRVFTYSPTQVRAAVERNDVTDFYLTFCNYLDSDPAWCLAKARYLYSGTLLPGMRGNVSFGFGPRASEFVDPGLCSDLGSELEVVARLVEIKERNPQYWPGVSE